MSMTYESALNARVDQMVDSCTRCGKCVEVCPITGAAGVTDSPQAVITGVLDILRTGEGPEAARKWATSCVLSGECIKACDDGVNPRFLLAMARVALAKEKNEPPARRRQGVTDFRKLSQDVSVLSRMQLTSETLERLGQRTDTSRRLGNTEGPEKPDFVFYTGCNVLKTPHIALLALDIMDALGVTYRVMGGPSHCCGVIQLRTGDVEASGSLAQNTLSKLASAKNGQVLSWCASCHVQFTEFTLPAHDRISERAGSRPFEMTPFMRFLAARLDDLRPLLRRRVDMRVALHRHPGVPGVMEAGADILRTIPGIEIVDLNQPAVGLMSNALRALPDYKRQLQLDELNAARDAGVDALVAVYHPDHRELCAHERDFPFRILNLLELVGESMGLSQEDRFKRLKKLQDVDLILSETRDLLVHHHVNEEAARKSVQAMLDEQPLALRNTGGGVAAALAASSD
ncbi:MAG TPA: (Fe-S)-binding protein [Xanthobacteraceae bacterium]|jgi:Fe-S oxidoreductase|nr:(Fe-S)-binding protein [Xanthobacteraceae bacterium]